MADIKSSSSSGGDSKSLAHQINVAIVSSHTTINRLILNRMPKAVPPQTENPSTYITGLLHIGAVYIAFESLWQNILGIHSEIAPIPYTYPFTDDPSQYDETPQVTERTRHILEAAYWSNLLRAARIKADIRTMTGWPDHVIDEQIRYAGTSGPLGKFTLHIRDTVNAKPHLLLAYAYCLYLALLSGGSYIRTELMYLKSEFWQATPSPIRPNFVQCKPSAGPGPGSKKPNRHSTFEDDLNSYGLAKHDPAIKVPLEFLDFDPPLGENSRQQTKDLKAEFKRRFSGAEQLLADLERTDIIRESTAIFTSLEGVVDQLDKIFGTVPTPQAKSHVQRALHPPDHSPRGGNMGFRLRDSIAIAKGRLLRTRRKSSGGSSVAPATAEDVLTTTDSHQSSESSEPSSVSSSSDDYEDARAEFKQPAAAPASDLVRDAVVPGEGFRTIRYDDDHISPPRPERSRQGKDGKGGRQQHGLDRAGLGRDAKCCPMTRSPTIPGVTVSKEGPDYLLFAVVSNSVLLLGVVVVFAAWLYARHGEGEARTGLLDL